MVNRCGIFKYSGNFVFIHLIIHYHFIKIIVFLVNSGAHNCDLKFHKAVLDQLCWDQLISLLSWPWLNAISDHDPGRSVATKSA